MRAGDVFCFLLLSIGCASWWPMYTSCILRDTYLVPPFYICYLFLPIKNFK